jgi:hypothetical protein
MEVGTLMGTNELAIPMGASDVPTERIFGSDRARVFQAATALAPTARSAFTASKGVLIGLCLMAFTLGILLTSTVDRARPAPPPPMARAQELPPVALPAVPEVVPVAAPPSVEPIVVAAEPAVVLDAPVQRRAILRPAREARARTARSRRSAPAVEAAAPETDAPVVAPEAPRPPAKKWVDPFAD